MEPLRTVAVSLIMMCSLTEAASALAFTTIKEKAQCVFLAVAERMKVPKVVLSEGPPALVYSEESSVDEFNLANEGYLKFKVGAFLNIYNAKTNTVFLATDPGRYKAPRTALDSMAHEFTHFFQFIEVGRDLNSPILYSDEAESEAVRVQEWFRETNPCGI
jgi:hypothetical protein